MIYIIIILCRPPSLFSFILCGSAKHLVGPLSRLSLQALEYAMLPCTTFVLQLLPGMILSARPIEAIDTMCRGGV